MQKNLALKKRESGKLKVSLEKANKDIGHLKEQVASYQRQILELQEQQSAFLCHVHEQQHAAPFTKNFQQKYVPRPGYTSQQSARNQVCQDHPYAYRYSGYQGPFQNSQRFASNDSNGHKNEEHLGAFPSIGLQNCFNANFQCCSSIWKQCTTTNT